MCCCIHQPYVMSLLYSAYRKAGRRPKKAMKVTSDTVTVKMMMLRASVMVKGRQLSFSR